MAAIVWADVTNFAGELSTVPLAAQTDILAFVNTAHTVANWGGEEAARLRLARIYLAAHFGTFARPSTGGQGPAGPVISKSEGDVSVAFASFISNGGSDPLLDETSYGRRYRQLLRSNGLVRGPVVV